MNSHSASEKEKKPIVFSGPSGSGKSTLVKRLMENYPDYFAFSVSHTTRQPRPGEKNGVHYHFVTREEMQKAIGDHAFIEHAVFSGNMYGTSKKAVDDVSKTGKTCILDIDMQGVKSLKHSDLNCLYIFIKPPSLQILEDRLRSRGTETEESVAKRLAIAKAELDYADQPGSYNKVIVNDDLESAYEELCCYLKEYIDGH